MAGDGPRRFLWNRGARRVATPGPLRFDRFQLLPSQQHLLADGQPDELGARALDLLCVLVEHAGRRVSKDQRLDAVWPDVIVEEANLHVQVSALRKVLGREAIATVPGARLPVRAAGAQRGADPVVPASSCPSPSPCGTCAASPRR